MKLTVLSLTLISALIAPISMFGQKEYAFEPGVVKVYHNDPVVLPKAEFYIAPMNIGNVFGARLYSQYRLNVKSSAQVRLTLPYVAEGEEGNGLIMRLGYQYSLVQWSSAKEKKLLLGVKGAGYPGAVTVQYTKDIPVNVGKEIIVNGGIEHCRLGSVFSSESNYDERNFDRGTNQRYTGMYLGLGLLSNLSVAFGSESFNGKSFDRFAYRSVRLNADLIYAFSNVADLYSLVSDFTQSNTRVDVSMDDAGVSTQNIGFRIN
ncbi:MAG: hypothetical protein ACK54P_18695, partial [Bacteroidota bacterium]